MKQIYRFAALLLMLPVVGCASTPDKAEATRSLNAVVTDYNDAIRWERPEFGAPYIPADMQLQYKKWHKDYIEDYDFQEWSIDEVTYETETTATVVIERKGFKIPVYIEKDFLIIQTWEMGEDGSWRLVEGF